MVRALVLKELRESAAIVAVAVLVALYNLAALTGVKLTPWDNSELETLPFVSDSLYGALTLVGGGLAIALGLKQTAWEAGRNTYHFLLHRPISRERLFAWKMVVGVALTLLVSGLLILAYALWAATPGSHAAPFHWSMTLGAWQYWAALPLLYAGAFASGIRPARWIGTRLAPLAVAVLVTFVFVSAPLWEITLPVLLLTLAGLLMSALYDAVNRDY